MSAYSCDELYVDLADGNWTISGTAMRCPAWAAPDLTLLWEEADKRGSDRILPGAGGVIANPKRRTTTRIDIPFVMTGAVSPSGTPYTNSWIGLQTNLALFNSLVVAPPALPATTRSSVLTMPDGTTRTADLHVLGLDLVESAGVFRLYNVLLELPMGRFV